jgi:hypothetical protein
MSKLKNVEAIQKMLDGTHRMQTRTTTGFSDTAKTAEKNQTHEVGDIWEEKNSEGRIIAIWEQKKGYRQKTSPNHDVFTEIKQYLNSYPNCYHEECKTKSKNRLDEKFKLTHGMCADCVFEFETKLKISGKWKDYEKERLLMNANAFFKNADTEMDQVYAYVSSDSSYANSDGTTEGWMGSKEAADKMIEEYKQLKDYVLEELSKDDTSITDN